MGRIPIAFLIGSLSSGGAERVVCTLCNELIKKYDITIITFTHRKPFYVLDDRIKLVSCFDEITPSKSVFQSVILNYKLYRSVSNYIKSNEVKIVLSFLTRENLLAIIATKFRGIPVIINERNNPYQANISSFWKYLWKFLYPKADILIVQTEEIKSYFKSFVTQNKIRILPNPISRDLTDKRQNQVKKNKIVLNVGRLTEQKSQDLLIRAFASLIKEDWELHIIGEGRKKLEYEQLIKSLNATKKIKLLKPTQSIYKNYNSSEIFAFTSIFEGFPNALMEAMHFGLACIATDCPTGPSELIENEVNGFLIPMNNQLELEEKLLKLMENEELRKTFSKNAVITVRKFEAKNIAQEWDDIITQTLSN